VREVSEKKKKKKKRKKERKKMCRCFVLILVCVFLFGMIRCQLVIGGQKNPPFCTNRIAAALP
jgi:hypothetical protein